MGTSVYGTGASVSADGRVTKFYTSRAWIEGRAEQQLETLAGWDGVRQIAAFPDLHPGKYGPIGCAVLADRIYPQLIGNDIGCGMSLFALDLPLRRFKLDKAARRLRVLGDDHGEDMGARLAQMGLPADLAPAALGTIGGGNHFCEVQRLQDSDPDTGLDSSCLYLLVHSGSRGVGNAVLQGALQGGFAGLDPASEPAQRYLRDHDRAVLWAKLNRRIIAERAAHALRADLHLVVDAPHNLLCAHAGGWLHRKGAALATGRLVPLAGSRAAPSFVLRAQGHPSALGSSAHGAGRRYDRGSMHGRVRSKRSDLQAMERTGLGGRVICEDRDLMIEEAPTAYKSAEDVAQDLHQTGVATALARFHPLITFKKTRERSTL